MPTPAQQLLGLTLDGGWRVIEKVEFPDDHTGGHFSEAYIVLSEGGDRAFLKALDFSKAKEADDPARALEVLTVGFNIERDLLQRCRGLDRVVRALTDGRTRIGGEPVQYLIFELAKTDIRSQTSLQKRLTLAWTLRAIHHMATGLSQLHGQAIAHQDLKPSNVLVFEGDITKIADLGRASQKSLTAPHDELSIAGAKTYAPPELHYGYVNPDWNGRRFGCDAYLLGSMIVFLFTGVGMTALLWSELAPGHRWNAWTGTWDEVLPYVRAAFATGADSIQGHIPSEVRESVITAVRELCDPDPRLRGHPLNRGRRSNQYSLERYVSTFNLLARNAELGLLKA